MIENFKNFCKENARWKRKRGSESKSSLMIKKSNYQKEDKEFCQHAVSDNHKTSIIMSRRSPSIKGTMIVAAFKRLTVFAQQKKTTQGVTT